MGRKRRRAEDHARAHQQAAEHQDQVPEHRHEFEHEHRSRRGRKLALLLAVAGGAAYLMRRNQRKAELDEGVWHEAPTPTTPTA